MVPPRISKLTFGRNASSIGIGQRRPTLSWRYQQDKDTDVNWQQHEYELCVIRNTRTSSYCVMSSSNIDQPWPDAEPDLISRERVEVNIRIPNGEWYTAVAEAALLAQTDWIAHLVGTDIPAEPSLPKRPFYLRRTFSLDEARPARIYATALGVYELHINGRRVGDHVMAPGWQSYHHRLHYQTYEIEGLTPGENIIEAIIAEGWYSGRLSWEPDNRNAWGQDIGLMMQLEIDGKPELVTDSSWEWRYGSLLASELYDGETHDESIIPTSWRPVRVLQPPKATLIAPEAPPIRRMESVASIDTITTPSGKTILDFGQNLVGWVRIKLLPVSPTPNAAVTLSFAEVLEKGELGVRPLRNAKATDQIVLGETEIRDWEPKFTTHGFRYCQIAGPDSILDSCQINCVAVVVHSDLERIGDFTCSHGLINQLHRNVVWGLKGNFVGLPTDCPQRAERLGWTGDIQVFGPTASLLYDTSGFLANWLHDLSSEQLIDNQGIVPLVVPTAVAAFRKKPIAQALWGDVCVITPFDLYQAYGSHTLLKEMWTSITEWLRVGIPRGTDGLWLNDHDAYQLGDWLDPRAPPEDPGAALTDPLLVADAYLVRVTGIAAKIAQKLGFESDSIEYAKQHAQLRRTFQRQYITTTGRMASDTQTAYTLAFQYELFEPSHLVGATKRLVELVTRSHFRISTGFAGTPGILHVLTQTGQLQLAYRMLQEKGCPSWLYPVTMGATTIWERWDSLLPDGSINVSASNKEKAKLQPGEMTSFNHYALGAVANWLHTTLGGLEVTDPGYSQILIRPQPGGTVTSASVYTMTPSGRAAVSWVLQDTTLTVDIEVPPNTTALLWLGSTKEKVGSGMYHRVVSYSTSTWPPPPYINPFVVEGEAVPNTIAE